MIGNYWDEDYHKHLKKVRKKRQDPAHVVDEDIFDEKYFKDQRELMIRAYRGQ